MLFYHLHHAKPVQVTSHQITSHQQPYNENGKQQNEGAHKTVENLFAFPEHFQNWREATREIPSCLSLPLAVLKNDVFDT